MLYYVNKFDKWRQIYCHMHIMFCVDIEGRQITECLINESIHLLVEMLL